MVGTAEWHKRDERTGKNLRAGMQRGEKPLSTSLAVLVSPGRRDFQEISGKGQEFLGEKESTGLLRGMRTPR